jgi:hypothetical protein
MTKPFHFEAKVESVSKNSKGIFLRLLISEAPPELMTMAVSQRLMVAASPLGDFDEDVGEGDRAVQLAGILCRSKDFWRFIETRSRTEISISSEDEAADWLRGKLGIDSRADLRQDAAAREQLRLYNERFQEWSDKASL